MFKKITLLSTLFSLGFILSISSLAYAQCSPNPDPGIVSLELDLAIGDRSYVIVDNVTIARCKEAPTRDLNEALDALLSSQQVGACFALQLNDINTNLGISPNKKAQVSFILIPIKCN